MGLSYDEGDVTRLMRQAASVSSGRIRLVVINLALRAEMPIFLVIILEPEPLGG